MASTTAQLLPFLGVLTTAVAIPFAVAGYRALARKKRRRLEQSRREILVLAGEEAAEAGACNHKRSKSRARQGADGTYRSICKYCEAPMKRLGPENWIVDTGEETSAPAGETEASAGR